MDKEKWLDDNGNEITEEYIIINKTVLQNRIEELEKEYILLSNKSDRSLSDIEEEREIVSEQKALAKILSQSTPLIPENINKILSTSLGSEEEIYKGNPTGKIIGKEEYLSNLKLDI